MGAKQSHQRQQPVKERPLKFVFQGLSSAGKSSISYRMKHGKLDVDNIFLTIGIDFQIFFYKGKKIQGWDFAMRERSRTITQSQMRGSNGYMFVIDSADVDSIDEALDQLNHTILMNELSQQTVVMVLANKQDLDGAQSPLQIEEKLKLKCCLDYGATMFVMPSSAITGEGVQLAFEYFCMQAMLKQEGKLKPGLIPHAWELADEELEKCQNNDNDETTQVDFPNKLETNIETNGVTSKKANSSNKLHKLKNLKCKDIIGIFKSALFY